MTPKEKAKYFIAIFSGDIPTCLAHCDKFIQADITPDFYELVKIELNNLYL